MKINKVLIAIDSFKGSITSLEAGKAAARGIKKVYPDAVTEIVPIADGGEGTVEALVQGKNGNIVTVEVLDPLGRKINCSYGIINQGSTAVIEMAASSGLTLLEANGRNPMHTTTYGVGQMIADAISRGCRNFLIGIGGSATNDGGIGMLQSLGFGILDSKGNQVPFGAVGLSEIAEITSDNALSDLKECVFNVACDVTNPLCGKNGCSAVFAPQKGADSHSVEIMDSWLSSYADKVKIVFPKSDKNASGAGAAGGLGFAFMSFLGAKLSSGIDLVLDELDFEEKIESADIIITGEGRLDGQTVMGKAPIGVAKRAKAYGKTVVAFAGSVTPDAVRCNENGIDAYFPIVRGVCTLEEAMKKENANANLESTAEQAFRLISVI